MGCGVSTRDYGLTPPGPIAINLRAFGGFWEFPLPLKENIVDKVEKCVSFSAMFSFRGRGKDKRQPEMLKLMATGAGG